MVAVRRWHPSVREGRPDEGSDVAVVAAAVRVAVAVVNDLVGKSRN